MNADDIRKLYWAEPFVPFQLILSDGREVRVTSPGHLTISATGSPSARGSKSSI
jgi:hypothetical protein